MNVERILSVLDRDRVLWFRKTIACEAIRSIAMIVKPSWIRRLLEFGQGLVTLVLFRWNTARREHLCYHAV